ncbi:MAG: hypothetical protein JNK53_01000, partial [Phycisphaerae bacterium]|nr:hypothetical protein [Phycisphaerae bacterium]
AILDDEEHRTGPILHGTRLTTGEYICGRWLGVAAVAGIVMALHLLIQVGFYQWYPVDEPDKVRGPFALLNFAWPFALFIGLPSLCLGAFTFAIGSITRQSLLVFLVPTAVLLASIFFLWTWSPEWITTGLNNALCVVDPTGFRWLNETWLKQDQGATFYNTTPLGLDGIFWANRGWQIALAAGSLLAAVAVERRRLRHPFAVAQAERTAIIAAADAADAATPFRPVHAEPGLRALGMGQRAPSWLTTAIAQARAEARELRRSPGLWIFVPLITLQTVGSAFGEPGPFNTPLLVTPGLLAARSFNTATLLALLMLLFYTTESLARDDRMRMRPIVASAGARSAARLVGKLAANVAVIVVALLAGLYAALVIAVAAQALIDQSVWIAPNPWPLLQVWAIFLLPTVVVWMGLIALVWSVTRNRYAVYGAGLAALILTGWLYQLGWVNWVGNWHLWSGVLWSDFGSFQLDQNALALNRVMWVLIGALLIQLALMAERRRTPDATGVVSRLRSKRIAWAVVRALPLAVPAFVVMMMLALSVRAGGEGDPSNRAAKAYRAANSETWRNVKGPSIRTVEIDVRLDPAAGTFEMSGEYVLTNENKDPIERFALTPGHHYQDLTWSFGGATHTEASAAEARKATRGALSVENSAGLWVFTPEQPLATGESARVGFRYHGTYPDGIGRNTRGAGEFILPAGVVLNAFSTSMLPLVGWVDGVGVDPEDAVEPRRHGVDEWKKQTKPGLGNGSAADVRATITVPEAYRAHAPGVLERNTVSDGWRTMVWRTDVPVRFFNIVAAKWVEAKGKTTTIWHLAEHTENIPSMLEALDGAREWYSAWFYPYPWQDLRVNEFPGLASYAQGFATNIVFSESIGFLAKPTPEEDAPFLVTAHEAAHQWWGNILMPGDGPGGNILSEGLAHYSTARLIEKLRGDAARRAFMRGIELNYGEGRVVDEERPMVEIDGARPGDTTVTYDKGGWVFWMLHDLMGAQACDAGMRDFIGRFKDGPDYPLLQDFEVVMREHAPDKSAFDAFMAQWMHGVVLPEFTVDSAVARSADGAWNTTVTVTNKGTGKVRVPVAVTNGEKRDASSSPGAPSGDTAPSAVYADARATVELDANQTATVEIPSAWKPALAVVDPDVRQLQAKRKNAERSVDVK